MLKKTKPNCWKQIVFIVPFIIYFWLNGWVYTAFRKKHRGLQLIKISSEGDRSLISSGPFFIGVIRLWLSFWSERYFFVASWQSKHLSVKKHKNEKRRSKLSLIRPKCAWIRLWSDLSDQIDFCSDHLRTIVQTVVRSNFRPDPATSVCEHTGVRSVGSDHKPIWFWTSTWIRKSNWKDINREMC